MAARYILIYFKGDGVLYEPALNYHRYSLSLLQIIHDVAGVNGKQVLGDYDDVVELAARR